VGAGFTSDRALTINLAHDLVGEPLHTSPDHALRAALEIILAFIGTGHHPLSARASVTALAARAKSWLFGSGDASHTSRLAGTAFLIRLSGAVLAYGSQILLALWMGPFQFGIFVYVWTWVILLGGVVDLGLCASAQRFIPEYTHRNDLDRLRGFQSGSRWLALALSSAAAMLGALAVNQLQPWLQEYELLPLYIACLGLPMCALLQVQSGIARAYNWVNLAQLPTYVFRQLLMIVAMGTLYFAALPTDAVTATIIATASVWVIALGQFLVLNHKLAAKTPPGPKAYAVKTWLTVSLPMVTVEGFYLLLTYSSILLLEFFKSPHDVAIYYAAEKTLALVAFVHFAVAQSTAHKFSHYHVTGDRENLSATLNHAIKLTFWPSLAATIVVLIAGIPLLWLFGPDFVAGYPLMFIFAVGMLARSAVGPLAAFLNMVGQQRACAMVFAAAFVLNVVLCVALIPTLGTKGAAIAMSAALVFESAALFILTKRRIGPHGLIWSAGRRKPVLSS
jgi:O-antigen/teichoic acid export membrane protein